MPHRIGFIKRVDVQDNVTVQTINGGLLDASYRLKAQSCQQRNDKTADIDSIVLVGFSTVTPEKSGN